MNKVKKYKLKVPFETTIPLTKNEHADLVDHLAAAASKWSFTNRILYPMEENKVKKE